MFNHRLRILLLFITLPMLGIVGRLAWLQLAQGEYYAERARVNIAYKEYVDTRRGVITDRNGVRLAYDEYQWDLCIIPANFDRLEDPDAWCRALADILERPYHDVRNRVDQLHVDILELAHAAPDWRWKRDLAVLRRREHALYVGLTPEEKMRLDNAGPQLPRPVYRGRERTVFTVPRNLHRVYPYGGLGAHIIGHVGPVKAEEYYDKGYRHEFDGSRLKRFHIDDVIGRGGIEARYERVLRGSRGVRYGIKDVRGRLVRELPENNIEPRPGRDVRLTLDARMQRYAEEALDTRVRELSAAMHPDDPPVCGALVILDPHTGDVLAAASFPRYDLNTVRERYGELVRDRRKLFFHRALAGAYPLGSVFKIVVAVAGIEEDILSGHTEFSCHGILFHDDRAFRCTGAHGTVELSRALERSCNVYFLQAGLLVGGERMRTWAERMGLARPTGVELTEASGEVPLCRSDGDVLNLAIGQGRLLVTPLQAARLMGCVALGGKLCACRLSTQQRIRIERVPLHPERLGAVRWGMRDVVGGRFGTARVSGRVVIGEGANERELVYAGKTGTAQTRRVDIYDAWFAGFAPFREPKIAFACVIESCRDGGGTAAGPVVARTFKRMLQDPATAPWLEGGLE
jgi:penicillin-binding protein 2